jgi:hypothetical protein
LVCVGGWGGGGGGGGGEERGGRGFWRRSRSSAPRARARESWCIFYLVKEFVLLSLRCPCDVVASAFVTSLMRAQERESNIDLPGVEREVGATRRGATGCQNDYRVPRCIKLVLSSFCFFISVLHDIGATGPIPLVFVFYVPYVTTL